MYIPPSNAEHSPEVMLSFIQAHPFGALVTASAEGLFATHLPLVLDRAAGPHGTLEGHVARANPHHGRTPEVGEALVIFQGPDAYITPSWYAAKAEHGRVVPTWNYVAVHAYGVLEFTDDPAFLRRHLEALTALHESGRDEPWAVSDAPPQYVEQLQRAIVGVRIRITRLEGKWKMSQNRSQADIKGVVRGLSESSSPVDRAVAGIVDARRPR
ncbi:MAG TPA: FMN-binding negative transcriptional regulator [Longimicrobium sp.]|nr:FMN-binding negative transcriptional regulator [Longimicrobium sp.]